MQAPAAAGLLEHRLAHVMQVPYGGSFHVELTWTATRQSAAQTRLQVVGLFVPEKRMLGVEGIIRKATKEVSVCYAGWLVPHMIAIPL